MSRTDSPARSARHGRPGSDAPARGSDHPTRPTILVVDDDPDVRTLLADVLIDDGYGVLCAVDGVAAIKSFVEHRPDLILLDVDMPRLRGVATLVVIHELAPETKIIIISGKADENEARRALALGAFDYVTKPFDLEHLRRIIQVAVL